MGEQESRKGEPRLIKRIDQLVPRYLTGAGGMRLLALLRREADTGAGNDQNLPFRCGGAGKEHMKRVTRLPVGTGVDVALLRQALLGLAEIALLAHEKIPRDALHGQCIGKPGEQRSTENRMEKQWPFSSGARLIVGDNDNCGFAFQGVYAPFLYLPIDSLSFILYQRENVLYIGKAPKKRGKL